MNKILELEALRGGAALYVFFHHTLFGYGLVQKSSILGKLFSFGQEAVMIFFLLSGYVIALSLEKRHYSFREYFKHRFIRIYPVIIVAWLVALSSLYFTNSFISVSLLDFVVNALMLQDIEALKPGVFANPLFGNSPLWSLSYEWWFYMLFYIHYVFLHKLYNKNLFVFNISAVLISLVGMITFKLYFNEVSLIVMYYYIWFSGAMALLLISTNRLNFYYVSMISSSYIVLIATYSSFFIIDQQLGSIGVHPILELRHYIVSFVGLLFALFFYKRIYNTIKNNKFYIFIIASFSRIAPISFSLYVLHYPIKNYFMFYSNVLSGFVLLLLTLLVTIILSYITEIKIYSSIKARR